MKIDAPQPPGLGGPGRAASKPIAKPETAGDPRSDVQLSSASTSLAAQEPTVNRARVQEIRQAISEGRFEINASAIADRLISTARELVDARRQA